MRPGKRRGVRSVTPDALADTLPEHLRNPNGVMRWSSVDEYQRAIADYLRDVGINELLAPEVSKATGVAACIVLRDRITASAKASPIWQSPRPARRPTEEPPEPLPYLGLPDITWTKDDELARRKHMQALAGPAATAAAGSTTAITNHQKDERA